MALKVVLEVPDWLEASDAAITKYIADHAEAYSEALDHSGYGYDERDRVDELEVTRVELTEQTVKIQYRVKLSIYRGCQDIELKDIEHREITGRRVGRVLEFDRFTPPDRRTTHEEF